MRRGLFLAVVSAAAVCGCRAVLEIDDKTYVAGGGGGAGGEGGDVACAEEELDCGDAGCVDPFGDEEHCGACGHSCAGGVCAYGACVPTVLSRTDSGFVPGIVTDDRYVYWSSSSPRAVRRALKTGSEAEVVWEGGFHPWALVLHDGWLYWTVSYDGNVMRTRVDGETLGEAEIVGSVPADKVPTGLATDGSFLYTSLSVDDGAIERAGLDGDPPFEVVVPEVSRALELAVDDEALYWSAQGEGRGLWRKPKNDEPAVWLRDTGAAGWFVLVDETRIFWHDEYNGALLAFEKPPVPNVFTVVTNEAARMAGMAMDDERIYYTTPNTGDVWSVRKDGTDHHTLAEDQGEHLQAIAVDDARAYWAASGRIWSVAK